VAYCHQTFKKKKKKLSFYVIIPAQGEFGSDIPAGDGKLANLFFTVYIIKSPVQFSSCDAEKAWSSIIH
jgi:hypothetical protein